MIMEDSEDILNDALNFLGEAQDVETDVIYGPLRLTIAPKEGKANTLLADHLFSPSIFLAERIERGLLPLHGKKVIELGAGCALPSLLLATLPASVHPSLVVITDYPDPTIMDNLQSNVKTNRHVFSEGCRVECTGYEWGKDISPLLSICEGDVKYDAVILSDLLHFDASHDVLVESLKALLGRSGTAIVAAGKYTHPHVCENFLRVAQNAGFVFQEVLPEPADSQWLGTMNTSFDAEALVLRKDATRFWIGKWQ